MNQPNQRNSLLVQENYRNPQHAVDAANLEAHDKAIADQGQVSEDTAGSEQPVHNWEKRYKDQQSYSQKKINGLEQTIADLQKQGVPKIQLPKTEAEVAAFKSQNPEVFAIIETLATQKAEAATMAYDQTLAGVKGDLMDTRIERATLAIRAEHPDFDAIVNSDKFHKWAEAQTQEVQDWIYNNPDEPSKAIRALSLFKYESGLGSSTGNTNAQGPQGDQSVNVRNANVSPDAVDRNHPAYIWTESEIAAMRPEVFGQWVEHITLAQREGRVALGQ